MKITDILHVDSIKVGLVAANKDELLEMMIDLAEKSGKITDKVLASKEVFNREKLMSTGVGKGIALPHAKTNAVDGSIGALAVLNKPIDFESLDGEPVNIVFLLIGKENNVGNHLRLLSKVSRLMNNDSFRAQLLHCKDMYSVWEFFRKVEESD